MINKIKLKYFLFKKRIGALTESLPLKSRRRKKDENNNLIVYNLVLFKNHF